MYRSEAAFSKALGASLKNRGIDVTRIETGLTSQGVPDMFIQGFGGDLWIELKNEPKINVTTLGQTMFKKNSVTIHWRPGQQAWALNYYNKHNKNKCSLTIVACDGFFIIVPMTCKFTNNKILVHEFSYFTTLSDLTNDIVRRVQYQED